MYIKDFSNITDLKETLCKQHSESLYSGEKHTLIFTTGCIPETENGLIFSLNLYDYLSKNSKYNIILYLDGTLKGYEVLPFLTRSTMIQHKCSRYSSLMIQSLVSLSYTDYILSPKSNLCNNDYKGNFIDIPYFFNNENDNYFNSKVDITSIPEFHKTSGEFLYADKLKLHYTVELYEIMKEISPYNESRMDFMIKANTDKNLGGYNTKFNLYARDMLLMNIIYEID